MNRAYGIAALVGVLGISAANPSTLLAQTQNEPIKFGQKGELTYEIAPQQYEGLDHRMTTEAKKGQNWGRIYINIDGSFQLWGDLNGTHFAYSSPDTLSMRRGNNNILIVDKPPIDENERKTQLDKIDAGRSGLPITAQYLEDSFQSLYNDRAYIDLSNLNLGPNFFEQPVPQSADPAQRETHELYSAFMRDLNVAGVRVEVERLNKTPQNLEDTLRLFRR